MIRSEHVFLVINPLDISRDAFHPEGWLLILSLLRRFNRFQWFFVGKLYAAPEVNKLSKFSRGFCVVAAQKAETAGRRCRSARNFAPAQFFPNEFRSPCTRIRIFFRKDAGITLTQET